MVTGNNDSCDMTKNYSRDFEDLANLQPSELKKSVLSVFGGKTGGIGSKKWVIEIADVVTWTEAFTIFWMTLCHTFPSCWKDLNQYKLLIIQTARCFSDKMASLRHRLQKRSASSLGSTD